MMMKENIQNLTLVIISPGLDAASQFAQDGHLLDIIRTIHHNPSKVTISKLSMEDVISLL